MRSKLLNADPPITYAVVLDTGDESLPNRGRNTDSISTRRSTKPAH